MNVIWLFYYLFIEYLACIHSAESEDIAMKSKIHYPLKFSTLIKVLYFRDLVFSLIGMVILFMLFPSVHT